MPFTKGKEKTTYAVGAVGNADTRGSDILKAYIPNFLYKPPYGMPRKVNTPYLKQLAKNSYVFSIIKTMCDEITSIDYEIRTKEEFSDDGQDYEEKIKEVTRFLHNPNGNAESFESILRQVVTDILECDSGTIIKVFNRKKELSQIFARDGSLFLKNPNIYGYLGDREDFVEPLGDAYTGTGLNAFGGNGKVAQQQLIKKYEVSYTQKAAYFQYGWTAGSMPVPFGKRELIYMMQNPRSDSIYGRSPVELLAEIIMTLVYGSEYNLDFYTNNNMPDGVIQLLGAEQEHIEQFRQNWENQFKFTDTLGKKRKKFFSSPITNQEVNFTALQLNPKDMDIIMQQEWFTKVMWMSFGVTADEMGFTENSNKAVGAEQTKLAKRKAIKPLLRVLEYHINTQLVNEFFPTGNNGEVLDANEVPIEFKFDETDYDEDAKKHTLFEQKIRMGVMTPEMAAKELGVDIDELKVSQESQADTEFSNMERQNSLMGGNNDNTNNFGNSSNKPDGNKSPDKSNKKEGSNFNNSKDKKDKKNTEEKAFEDLDQTEEVISESQKVLSEIDKHLELMEEGIIDLVNQVPDWKR